METWKAFAMGVANRGRERMVFDWDKAARIIKQRPTCEASAGLEDDWEWTGGTIYSDGHPIMNPGTYLASTWAVPQLDIDGETIECYLMESESPGWDEDTVWPESALSILKGDSP